MDIPIWLCVSTHLAKSLQGIVLENGDDLLAKWNKRSGIGLMESQENPLSTHIFLH